MTDKKNLLGAAGLVMQGTMETGFDFEEFAKKNIFNNLSSTSNYGFYYSPYGYFFRHTRWGTVNELGFRIDKRWEELILTKDEYFNIGLFGGSTGFDVLTKDEESLYFLLEDMMMKKKSLTNKVKKKFRVINLSQPGNLVLNQIFNYILFGDQLGLSLVISHNPVNDFATLQMNDPRMVSGFKIGYCDVLEAWSRKIHDNDGVDIDYDHAEEDSAEFQPAKIRNNPYAIIEAYHYRISQFCNIVTQSGKIFVNGFQPWITSKKELSESEENSLKTYKRFYQDVYQNVPILYDLYFSLKKYQDKPGNFLNLHDAFGKLNGSDTHFGDVCHLVGAGNEYAAKQYADFLERILS